MKLTVGAENPIERLILALGIAPVTLMDTHVSFMRARAIMVATKLGIFDALASGALTAADVASRCGTSPAATEKLMNALAGTNYLRFERGTYALSAVARKWVTRDSPQSIRDKVLFEFIEWTLVEHFEEFVRTGQPPRHASFDLRRGVGIVSACDAGAVRARGGRDHSPHADARRRHLHA
jgi:Dimerisation domain